MGTVRYTVIDGEEISETRNGVRSLYVPDSLGSTVALLDDNQVQTDTFSYWPCGENDSRTGTNPTPFQFVGTAGYFRDSDSRTYVRARTLNTTVGRWMSSDPIGYKGGDLNLFRYVRNGATSMRDPAGLADLVEIPSPWPIRPYGHRFIRFGMNCGGLFSAGYYPNGADLENGRRSPIEVVIGPEPLDGSRDGYPLLSDNRPAFERALCACVMASVPGFGALPVGNPIAHLPGHPRCPAGWRPGAYMCGEWARDMWNCALRKLGQSPIPSPCPGDPLEEARIRHRDDGLPPWKRPGGAHY